MLQLAWSINYLIANDGSAPAITWNAPAAHAWYNSNQTVGWDLTGTSNNGAVPNGVAGYSSAWDADPGDQYEEPTPGPAAGNPSLSYYTGPQTPTPLNFAAGGLVLSNSLSQGCHTANVRAWDNAGISSDNTYGPVCWDTIVPHTTSALSGTHASGSTTIYLGTVTVTLTASDPGSSSGTGSGVATTYYEIDNGGFQTYNGPFSVTSSGFNEVYFYSVDKAGNVESIENTGLFQIITTSTTLTSSPNPSNYGQVVTFTATVTASNGSVPTGSVSFYNFTTLITTVTLNSSGVANGGTSTLTGGTRSITAKYNGASGKFPSSTSSALNQVVNALATTSHLTASPNPSTSGQSVAFTATVTSSSGVTPYGTVEFYNGTAVITGVNLNSSGVAVLNYANLTVGAHSITAKFLPTLDFAGSTSAAVSQVVNTITTNTVLENAPNPSLFGQSVTLTAIVLATNGPTPTGKATFYNGTTSLGSSTLNGGGVATLNTTLLPVGTDNLTVSYGGSTKEAPSTSAAVSQVVNAVTTTTALATSPNPSNAGQSVTLTATVTSATGARPTGLVYFYNGGVAIGSETLNTSGVATLSGAGLPTGTDSITATYVETASFLGSTSAAVAQVVNQVTTTTTLATSPNPSYNGGSVTMTATVVTSDGAKATGTVTFYNNGVSIGTGTLNASGVATLAYTRLPVGTDSITATYAGTALIVGSTSAAVSQVVNPVTTAATVTTSPNPSYYGQAVTFTATVTASNGLHPTGTVQFYYGTTFIGSETLSASAVATLSYAGMSAGTWNITAKYLGAGVYPAITSNAESQEVNQATTTTVLTTSPNPSAPGQSVAMTATVSASNGLVPTGAVQFYNSGTVITAVNLNASGVAVLNYTGLTNGPHSLTAVHLVNVDYAGSTSNAVSQLVAYPTTTVLTTSPNPSIVGQAITMTATVTASTGTPTGTVTFYNGASAIGTPQTLSGSGVATLGYSGLPAGTDSLTAVYNGSGAFAGSSSAAVAQVVNMATTSTALTTSPNPSTQGQAVTMTATVTCSSGMPTGTASIYNGATAIGTPQTLSGSGVATLSYAGLPAGTDSLTAAYPGMGSCGPSTSVPVSQVVSPPYTDNVLYTFAGQPDGLSSFANLIVDSLGNLYGTTYLGGTSDNGTVFELSPPSGGTGPWTETVLYSFTGGSDGGYPVAGLIFDSQGNLYGTTEEGGNGSSNFGDGVAFELSPPRGGGSGPWNEVVLYAFCAETNCTDGERPYGGLVFDSQGNLYGTTNWGGSGGELSGAVFELSPPSGGIGLWTESVLYSFCSSSGGTCTDGERPYGSLIFDAQGNLYGTTELGGANSEGAVFELSPPAQSGAWTENVLYSFCPSSGCSDGYLPVGTLTFDSLGNLYGTTRTGGANGGGVVFELTPPASGATWTENVLYSFCSVGGSSCFDGGGPYYESLIFDSQGNLYGTTSGGGASGAGAVFEVSPPSGGIGPWSETVLYSFTGASDGGGPYAGLIFDSQGNLYGTTENSPGVVFALSPPATPKRR
ncbi:MAG: Ig-like domain repeat protein [Terriglobales bacterium]